MQSKVGFLVSFVIYIILILFLFLGATAFGQIDLEINDNMLVQTSGGLVIEVSGNLVENGSSWKGYRFGSTGTSVESNDVTFPQSSATDLVISEGVGVKAKIFLEGPYDKVNHNIMKTDIHNIIPLTSPYSADERTVTTRPTGAVDWVLVQLRDQTTPSTIIASCSAFLKSDGNLIGDAATSDRGIGIAAPPGNYYVSIKYRNHLAVMTLNQDSSN